MKYLVGFITILALLNRVLLWLNYRGSENYPNPKFDKSEWLTRKDKDKED